MQNKREMFLDMIIVIQMINNIGLYLCYECQHESGHDSSDFMYIGWPAKCTHIYYDVATCDLLTKLILRDLLALYLMKNVQQQIVLLSGTLFKNKGPREFVNCVQWCLVVCQ